MALTDQIRSIFYQQCRLTSVKGIPRLLRSRSRFMRYLWAVSILCFLSTAVYLAWAIIHVYRKYGILTSLKEHTRDFSPDGVPSLKLPDMTFCNLNPLANDFQDVPDIPLMSEYIHNIRGWSTCRKCSKRFNDTVEDLVENLMSTSGYFTYIGADNAQRIGHSEESFIASCHLWVKHGLLFKLVPCQRLTRFVNYLVPTLYNCYTLNIPEHVFTSKMVSGVMIVFHLDNYGRNDSPQIVHPRRYLGYLDGITFAMHERGYPPDLSQRSLYVQSGLFSDVKLTVQHRKRLSSPYGHCQSTSNEYNIDPKGSYSQHDCFSRCIKERILMKCECVETSLDFNTNSSNNATPPCLTAAYGVTYAVQKYRCTNHIKSTYANHCSHSCPLPCEEYGYLHEMSSSAWPSNRLHSFHKDYIMNRPYEHHYTFMSDYPKTAGGMNNWSMSELRAQRLISHNFAALQVKLDHTTLLEFVDRPEMTTPAFLSQMGGTLNLWAGITVVVGVELVELLYMIIMGAGRKSSEENTCVQENGEKPPGEEVTNLKTGDREEDDSTWDFTDTL